MVEGTDRRNLWTPRASPLGGVCPWLTQTTFQCLPIKTSNASFARAHLLQTKVTDFREDIWPPNHFIQKVVMRRFSLVLWLALSAPLAAQQAGRHTDRKSTRLNSSHSQISYAVFCLKKKKKTTHTQIYPTNRK